MNRNRSLSVGSLLSIVGLAHNLTDRRQHMIVNSPIFNEISGKLGGAVGMTSRFGMQLRGLVTGNNPQSEAQFIVRNIAASLSAYWTNTLTDVERASWSDLAEDTPGASDGKGLFTKANSLRLRLDDALDPIVLTAPDSSSAVFNDTPATIVVENDTGDVSLNFAMPFGVAGAGYSDSWAVHDGGAIAVSVSRPQRATRTTKIKPFVFIGHLNGDTTPASRPVASQQMILYSASGHEFDNAFAACDVGDVVYVQFQATDYLGRITAKFVQRVTCTAP